MKFSMWYQGTEGTDSSLSCVISFGPHSNPVRRDTVMINIQLRLKLSGIKYLDTSGGFTVFPCKMQLANWSNVSLGLC